MTAPDNRAAEKGREQYRVICPDGWFVTVGDDAMRAADIRFAYDEKRGRPGIHRDCVEHKVESRTVEYGPWK